MANLVALAEKGLHILLLTDSPPRSLTVLVMDQGGEN